MTALIRARNSRAKTQSPRRFVAFFTENSPQTGSIFLLDSVRASALTPLLSDNAITTHQNTPAHHPPPPGFNPFQSTSIQVKPEMHNHFQNAALRVVMSPVGPILEL